jgi:hypothetical protein
MSKEDTIYRLRSELHIKICCHRSLLSVDQVIQAIELPLTKRKHLPNAYLEVRMVGFEYKNKVVKRSRDPCWNEDILL